MTYDVLVEIAAEELSWCGESYVSFLTFSLGVKNMCCLMLKISESGTELTELTDDHGTLEISRRDKGSVVHYLTFLDIRGIPIAIFYWKAIL